MIKNTLKKLYLILGLIFLIFAIVGIILPIIPTTPFVLVAIYFFNKSSKKFHAWCLNFPFVGKSLEDWNNHKVIRTKSKIQASILITLSMSFVLFLYDVHIVAKIIISIIIFGVLLFLLTRNSKIN